MRRSGVSGSHPGLSVVDYRFLIIVTQWSWWVDIMGNSCSVCPTFEVDPSLGGAPYALLTELELTEFLQRHWDKDLIGQATSCKPWPMYLNIFECITVELRTPAMPQGLCIVVWELLLFMCSARAQVQSTVSCSCHTAACNHLTTHFFVACLSVFFFFLFLSLSLSFSLSVLVLLLLLLQRSFFHVLFPPVSTCLWYAFGMLENGKDPIHRGSDPLKQSFFQLLHPPTYDMLLGRLRNSKTQPNIVPER